MLKNYFVTIFRQINKNRIFSFINIFGLGLGMAAVLVIAQYVSFHSSFDKFHADADRIFRIESNASKNGEELGQSIRVPLALGEALEQESPELKAVASFYYVGYTNSSAIYKTPQKTFNFEQSNVYTTQASAFDLFTTEFAAGNGKKFNEPFKAIMTESNALKFFDDFESAIGKTFTLSGNTGSQDYELVGIMKDMPANSHLDFELLLSYPSIEKYTNPKNWGNNGHRTYLKVTDLSKKEKVLADINRVYDENNKLGDAGYDFDFYLQPIKDIHLGTVNPNDFKPGVDMTIIVALSAIAIIILVIAWINYMNLSLVRTIERIKEMGIRKCMGSSMKQITSLFIFEAFVMNLIALVLAIILTQIFENYLISITGLPVSALMNVKVLALLFGLLLLGTMVVGFYPYALLKAINIASVLVGGRGKVGSTKLRKSLVFAQFVITFLLITGTLTVYNQISYMRDADLKIDIENVLVVKSPPGDINSNEREDVAKFNTLKTELLKYTGIPEITNAGDRPGEDIGWGASIYLKNSDQSESVATSLISMDTDFPKFFGIDLVAGRNLKRGDDPWTKGDVVINEKMSKMLGFTDPELAVGAELDGFYVPLTVRGVLENHHHTSLHTDFSPITYIISGWTEYYFIKLRIDESSPEKRSDQLQELVATVESEWDQVFSDFAIDYFFLDSSFDEQYKEDIRFGQIFSGFATIAIIIACLGLFGLTSFTIQQRTKEIGIRKVLGASFNNLTMLLSKEYLILVLIACVMSIPVAWWLMSQWLETYTFRVQLGWWFYLVPLLFVIGLAFLSIISKVIGTVKVNPIESLRYE